MGTNFYTLKGVHIGKRSFMGDNKGIHFTWHAKDKKEAMKKIARLKKVKNEYGKILSIESFLEDFKNVKKESFIDGDFS